MAVENATVAVFILVGIVALDFHDFGDEAPAGAACEMHDDVERIADVGLYGAVREVHAALQDAAGKSREALPRGGGVNAGKTAGVSRVEKLQKIEGLATSNFPEDQTVRPVTKRALEEFPDGNAGQAVLRWPGFETDEIVLAHVNLGGVLNEEDAFVRGNEFSKDIEQRSFS